MTFYRKTGRIPNKHLTAMRDPSGRLYYEELFSSAGFAGASSLVYRIHAPNSVTRVERYPNVDLTEWDPEVTRPHLLQLDRFKSDGDFVAARQPLFFNDDLVFSLALVDSPTERFFRNSYADELIVIARGAATLKSTFGDISCQQLDFVYIPRGTTVQWIPALGQSNLLVVVETHRPMGPPARYVSPQGQLLERAPYHERDIRGPELVEPIDARGDYGIVVKAGPDLSEYHVDRHPFDVVGWDGYLYPYALNLRDFEPISGRLHQMPDMYQVLAAEGAAICATTPLRLADHPDAAPAQPHHNNLDYDEINFRMESTAPEARKDFRFGNITLNPRAFSHGPVPGFEVQQRPTHSSVFGLMVDVERPLKLTGGAQNLDDLSYLDNFITNT